MEISSELLKEKIQNGDKVIVDFYASWCGPCKVMKPTFEMVSKKLRESDSPVELYTMNVEDNQEFAAQMGIRAVPTIISFSNGVDVNTVKGMQTESQINDLTKQLLNG